MADSFIHLHNRSAYSFGSALTRPRQLAEFAAAHGMPAIALTDRDGLYAAVQFQQACERVSVKPIFGAELSPAEGASVTLLAESLAGYGNLCRLITRLHLGEKPLTWNDLCEHAGDLICLLGGGVESLSGATQASFSPAACGGANHPHAMAATSELTPPHAAGLNKAGLNKVESAFARLRDAFAGRLYVELAIHDSADAPAVRRRAQWADHAGLPVVATCESRCLRREQALLLRALASIGTLTLLDQPHPDKPLGAWHLRSPQEMEHIFARRPDALRNTLAIAEQCDVTLDLGQSRFPGFDSPDGRTAIEHLHDLAVAGCRRRYVEQPPLRGIGGRRPTLTEALERLYRELSIVQQVRYAEYFLVFHEIAEYCRRAGISFLARGSAADSLVCYALGVSHACPFRFDLPFDRFINPERAKFSKMADIDLDLPWDRRDQVIAWVYDRWGHDRVAMIGAPNTFHARAGVAELGKVYGLPPHEVHRVTRLLPWGAHDDLSGIIASSPESQSVFTELEAQSGSRAAERASGSRPSEDASSSSIRVPSRKSGHADQSPVPQGRGRTREAPQSRGSHTGTRSPESSDAPDSHQLEEPYATILQMAPEFEGLPRHWAMHPCGLVVSPEPLTDLVPVQRSPKGPLIAQYDMDAIEDLGFVKVDLLGQAGLSVLRDAVAEINRGTSENPRDENVEGRIENVESKAPPDAADSTRQPPPSPFLHSQFSILHSAIDLARDVDYADAATWDLIASGNARGVHHIESPAMTNLIQQCNCRDIDCLTTVVAIIRPGAANQGKKDAFARRYQGLEPAAYVHPALEPALRGTYGLMVFEEHILQVATEFGGLNLGRADVLRRALNKQKRDLIAELKDEFYTCARARGRGPDEIDVVWSQLEGFSGFMFNKAHSAEYAVEAFQGAWLKRRWPAQYLAAILSNYRGFYASSPTLPQILYVMEALRLGIGFLPPCINRSRERFSVEYIDESGAPRRVGTAHLSIARAADGMVGSAHPTRDTPRALIRIPVSHIHGLSQAFIDRHLAERARGPFPTLADFVERFRPGDAEAQLLLDSGALDCFGDSRPAMFWQLRKLVGQIEPDRLTLWGESRVETPAAPPVTLTEPDAWQIARREMELLGFPITIDPLTCLGRDDKGRQIDWRRYVPVAQLGQHVGRRVSVCGLMVADRLNSTVAGDLMKFVTLADCTGFIETILFPDAYRRFGHLTVANPILAATGLVEPFENRNGFTLRVQQVAPPARAQARR